MTTAQVRAPRPPTAARPDTALAAYEEVIVSQGVRIAFVPAIVTPRIERPLRNSRYERGEAETLSKVLRPGDRVLELGAGLGLLSTIAARAPGVDTVCTVEANPGLIPMIRETHRLNGVTGVEVLNAIVVGRGAGEAASLPFYLHRDFWASSMEPRARPYEAAVDVPCLPFARLLAERRPSVVVCDIEGAELDLFEDADLSTVRAVVVELHPKVYGPDGARRVEAALAAAGLCRAEGAEGSSVQLFVRAAPGEGGQTRADAASPPVAPGPDRTAARVKVIRAHGVKVPFVRGPLTRRVAVALRKGVYRAAEVAALRALLGPGDRVLDLGAGFGLLGAVAASVPGVEAVTAVEADPALLPVIRQTLKLNRAWRRSTLVHAAVTPDADARTLPFYVRDPHLASSADPRLSCDTVIEVPAVTVTQLVARRRPTVIVCDIAGAEADAFAAADLSGVRAVLLRVHPRAYDEATLDRLERAFTGRGLLRQPALPDAGLRLFLRNPARADRDGAPWPPESPRVLVATCMKNEGPFILEWLAWHRAAGVTDFVVYTNDCTDGTDRLLDRLAQMGLVSHLPNPAVARGSTFYQPEALAHVATLPVFAQADFVISMDVDEFVNVRVGQGRLRDLFAVTGPFDVLSMFELNHGANGRERYERGWLKDLFPRHQTERPGPRKAVRGVKSLVRPGPRIQAVRNHRPDLSGAGDAVWLDGSGRPLRTLAEDRGLNGADCRGGYDLVSLDHFALRSLGSYLAKMDRGDVVINGRQVGARYWRTRNANEAATSTFAALDAAARAEHARLLADPELARLHEAACAAHEARIATLLELPGYRDRFDWIRAQAWEDEDTAG